MSEVFVVLSTFNGARFLASQLDSLRRQSFTGWNLLVRDDGSTDGTARIVDDFAAADSRIRVVPSDGERLGPAAGFGCLLNERLKRGADRVFLCDQDDVWMPDKMERQLQRLDAAELRLGADVPMLVHSDLCVVDEHLQLRDRSFFESQRLRHVGKGAFGTLAVQNFVTGCTVLANRAALQVALPIPSQAVMHDWWIALCTAGVGRVLFEPTPTVLYRQHDANAVGSKGYWMNLWRVLARRRRHPFGASESTEFQRAIAQAEAAADRLADFEPRSAKLLAEFVDLWRHPPHRRRRLSALRRLGTRRLDPLRQLLLQGRLLAVNSPIPLSRSEKSSPFAPRMETATSMPPADPMELDEL